MKLEQRALRFRAGAAGLIGIVDVPERPLVRGMLILPDSTQYRAGSHRQFTLLSRLLAARGVAVMRFDRAGFGDSEGEGDAPGGSAQQDIGAAMKEFFIHVPEMKESVILAPGDAAPLAAGYALRDARVTGLALVHPQPGPGEAAAVAAPPSRPPRPSAAERLLRRAGVFRRALGPAGQPVQPPEGAALAAYAGRILLIAAASADTGAACTLQPQEPRRRRVDIAGGGPGRSGERGERGSAWREALAFACASWLTSW